MPEGYYITCDDALCSPCYEDAGGDEGWEDRGGFEDWDRPIAIWGYDEADTPTHCADCGILIDQNLTSDGLTYISESILDDFKAGQRNPVVVQWIKGWEDVLSDDDLPPDLALDMGTVLTLHESLPLDRGEWATKYLAHIGEAS